MPFIYYVPNLKLVNSCDVFGKTSKSQGGTGGTDPADPDPAFELDYLNSALLSECFCGSISQCL